MTSVWALAALWLGLAAVATILSIWLRVSTALSEIAVGTIAQFIFGLAFGPAVLGTDEPWVKFLAGIGAIVLTFLAGAELDPQVFKLKWKEAVAVGLASFSFPFLGCAAPAHYWLGWEVMPSWLPRYHWIHEQFGQIRLSSIRSSATKFPNASPVTVGCRRGSGWNLKVT
jgi:glutathione-regulated potassium-efflux system ancillary protein KefC